MKEEKKKESGWPIEDDELDNVSGGMRPCVAGEKECPSAVCTIVAKLSLSAKILILFNAPTAAANIKGTQLLTRILLLLPDLHKKVICTTY